MTSIDAVMAFLSWTHPLLRYLIGCAGVPRRVMSTLADLRVLGMPFVIE
jgi:hypothetical protein